MITKTRGSVMVMALLTACPPGDGMDTAAGTSSDTGADSDTGTTAGPEEEPLELDDAGCVPKCIKDVDISTPIVDTDCVACDHDPIAGTCRGLKECLETIIGIEYPAGETACFMRRIDDGTQNPSPYDDLSQICRDRGSNAEMSVMRLDPAPAGTVLAVTGCTWSPDPAVDCPALPP